MEGHYRMNTVEPDLTYEERNYWAVYANEGICALKTLRGEYLGGTCVIAGNGPSLEDIPSYWLNEHTTFGVNYCHKREDFHPCFYVVGDVSVGEHEWAAAWLHHRMVPMFLPSPGMDSFGTDRADVYRYKRVKRKGRSVSAEMDPTIGIAFTSVTQAATMLAYYLGFCRILLVGLDGGDQTQHFYGKGYPNDYNRLGNEKIVSLWDEGFMLLNERMRGVEIINLSTRHHIPSLAHDNWRNF